MIILVTCLLRWPTIASGQQEKELSQSVKELQEKIKELEKTVKDQQRTIEQAKKAYERVKKQLDEQIQENERLKTLCEKAGIITTELKKTAFEAGDIVYRGKKRTQKWFERMYERFYDKIAYFGGDYVEKRELSKYRTTGGLEVLSVLSYGEVLAINDDGFVRHLYGLNQNFVDGASLPGGTLLQTGVYEYVSVSGAHKTVPSCTVYVYEPLTREQFADAITSGFKLISYEKRGEKIVERPIR